VASRGSAYDTGNGQTERRYRGIIVFTRACPWCRVPVPSVGSLIEFIDGLVIRLLKGVNIKMLSHKIPARIVLTILLASMTLSAQSNAETIAVIGTGDVAGALGPEFANLGHDIVYGSRNPERDTVKALVKLTGGSAYATTPAESVIDADIVILAVPGALVEAITLSLGDLSGKIIIDPTNYFTEHADGMPMKAGTTSNGEIIQAAAPDAFVVKAFSTLNWQTMVDPDSAGGPVTIPLVGNSATAKATVAALAEGMGLKAIDLGPIRYARHVEGMLIVWINANFYGGTGFEYHLRKVAVD